MYILIVEDNPVNQKIAHSHLEKAGYSVTVAADGREAVEICNDRAFDLILMDVQMPEMDGFEATRRIRESAGNCARVPIIGLTADADQSVRQSCLEAGMNDVIAKPISRGPFLSTIAEWLTSSSSNDLAPQEPAASGGGSDMPLDYDRAVREFGGDRETVDAVLEEFIKDLGVQIPRLRDFVSTRNSEAAESLVHRIKGAAINLAAVPLATALEDLEIKTKSGNIEDAESEFAAIEAEFGKLKSFMADKWQADAGTKGNADENSCRG